MPKWLRWKLLSVRLSVTVVTAMSLLLLSSLAVMLFYARKAIKDEALQKAAQTLEETVLRIDNILLSAEQAAGNHYFNMWPYLNDRAQMLKYCRRLVESNPYIQGCAIAFEPGYFAGGESFATYFHYVSGVADSVVHSDSFSGSSYTEEPWFKEPMATGKVGWMRQMVDLHDDEEACLTFCLPIINSVGKTVGVMAVNVSLVQFSRILLSAKPSANSYGTLLDGDGTFIIHPDSSKLFDQSVFTLAETAADASVRIAGESILSGETGYKRYTMNGADYYVFYKPFKQTFVYGRVMKSNNWSVCIIYPKDDIFGPYNSLSYYVLAIAIVGLLLLFVLCFMFLHYWLKPLRILTKSAQHIADGHYDETIPNSRQHDEIGRLQDNFQQMQQSLATHIGELKQLTATLQERGKVLRKAYDDAQKADRLKTTFLNNMTNQMVGPSEIIDKDVVALSELQHCDCGECVRLVGDIQANGKAITELLNHLISLSDEENRKEVPHD